MEVHTTERTRHFLVKKPKKILQLRLEDKNVFNAIHLNSIGYVFEFGVDFDSLDQQPVYLFFMITAPAGADNTHLQALAKLSSLLINPDLV